MRILADTRLYPPTTYAGAEMMMHGLLRHLADEGHDVRVLVREGEDANVDRIQVLSVKPDDAIIDDLYLEADVCVSHLEASMYAQQHAARADKPLVHLVHNAAQLKWFSTLYARLVVFNSFTLRDACLGQHPGVRSTVLHPPIRRSDVYSEDARLDIEAMCGPVDEILQSNLSDIKGGHLFWRLAQRECDRHFTGITGGYGAQILRGADNVTILPHVPHDRIAWVYAHARVLLIPSDSETWGIVAAEAMMNGLPIIAHHSPGLAECIGTGGVDWCHRGAVEAWSAVLAMLDDPDYYAYRQQQSLNRSYALEAGCRDQLEHVTRIIEELA